MKVTLDIARNKILFEYILKNAAFTTNLRTEKNLYLLQQVIQIGRNNILFYLAENFFSIVENKSKNFSISKSEHKLIPLYIFINAEMNPEGISYSARRRAKIKRVSK